MTFVSDSIAVIVKLILKQTIREPPLFMSPFELADFRRGIIRLTTLAISLSTIDTRRLLQWKSTSIIIQQLRWLLSTFPIFILSFWLSTNRRTNNFRRFYSPYCVLHITRLQIENNKLLQIISIMSTNIYAIISNFSSIDSRYRETLLQTYEKLFPR